MRLALGSDHAGIELKVQIKDYLISQGHEVESLGAESTEPYDYPLASDAVACSILEGRTELGILVCGSGIGVSIRANRHKGIRAALCLDQEMARLARAHNHANVLCLPGRGVESNESIQIIESFLNGPEDHAERHDRRVAMFDRNVSC